MATKLLSCSICITFIIFTYASSLPRNSRTKRSGQLANEKKGNAKEIAKSAEDRISMDFDQNDSSEFRFRRELGSTMGSGLNTLVHYEDHLPMAPWYMETVEWNTANDPSPPEIIVWEIQDLTTTTRTSTTTSTSTTTTTPWNPQRNFAPPRNPDPPFVPVRNQVPAAKTVPSSMRLSPESHYMEFSHAKWPCQISSDCYNMREPDEWCSSVTVPNIFFERGCFCDGISANCLFERRIVESGSSWYQHTDCVPKSQSKCD